MDPTPAIRRSATTALLVIDVQAAAVARGPYRGEEVLANIAALIGHCRTHGVEVIYVQHDGAPGEDEEPGTPGWEIHPPIGPAVGEKVFRKRFNSAFRGTELRTYLDGSGVRALIIVGIQTEYCVDTTVRVAFEYGFMVIMPEMTNTTFDNGDVSAQQIYELYNGRIFDNRFAAVPSLETVLADIAATGAAPL